eukprot:7839872-Pyramimonas_sp.AAC.1
MQCNLHRLLGARGRQREARIRSGRKFCVGPDWRTTAVSATLSIYRMPFQRPRTRHRPSGAA